MEREAAHRLVGIGALVGLGVAGLVVPALDALADGLETSMELLGVLAPLLLATPIWWMAHWMRRHVPDGTDALVVAGWCFGFAVAAALITATAILAQAAVGVHVLEPLLLVNNVGVVGGNLGVIVGHFHVSTRQRGREYRAARDALAEQKQHLLFLNRLLRHDIRNDVNVIHGYAELLAEEHPDEPYLDTIIRKSEEIDELTVLARDLSESADGELTGPVAVAPAIEEAVEHVRDSFPDASVRVEGDVPAGLSVSANGMLPAVFQNLLRNAVQHNDGPEPEATVRTVPGAETVRVEIEDNGPGIPAAIRHSLFEAGRKGAESSGTGLGLYLVETLVTSYGGDVWVDDAASGGALVTVELRRAD